MFFFSQKYIKIIILFIYFKLFLTSKQSKKIKKIILNKKINFNQQKIKGGITNGD
jgi:hypothetical protein